MPVVTGDLPCKRLLYSLSEISFDLVIFSAKKVFGEVNFHLRLCLVYLGNYYEGSKILISCTIFSIGAKLGFSLEAHSLSTCANFSEKLTFHTPDTHTYLMNNHQRKH